MSSETAVAPGAVTVSSRWPAPSCCEVVFVCIVRSFLRRVAPVTSNGSRSFGLHGSMRGIDPRKWVLLNPVVLTVVSAVRGVVIIGRLAAGDELKQIVCDFGRHGRGDRNLASVCGFLLKRDDRL